MLNVYTQMLNRKPTTYKSRTKVSSILSYEGKPFIICGLSMVEAAGVEPASEIVVSRETPCLVAFRRFASCAQNGQDTHDH